MKGSVTTVESFRFLGTTISQDLKWDNHMESIVKKTQQRLYFLRQLRKFNLPQELLIQFYSAIIESVLCTSITVWFSSATKSDLRRLRRVVRTAERIIGTTLPPLQELYLSRVRKEADKITLDPHIQHTPSLNGYRLAPLCNHPSLIDKRGILLWCLHLLWCSLILHLSCNVKPPAGMSPSLSPRQPSKRTVKQSWHRPPRDGGECSFPGGAGNTTPYPVGWRSDNLLLPLFSVLPKLLMKELFPQFLSHSCHSRAVSKAMFPHSQPGYALLVHLDKVLGPDATTPLWRIHPVWWKDLLS